MFQYFPLFISSYFSNSPLCLLIFTFLYSCFENQNFFTVNKFIRSFFEKKFEFSIIFTGVKQLSPYASSFQSFHASPGFMALNQFLIDNLKEGRMKNIKNAKEIVYKKNNFNDSETNVSEVLTYQMENDSIVYIDKVEYKDVFFKLSERKYEKNKDSKLTDPTEMSKISLTVCSNIYNVQYLMKKCDKIHQDWESLKNGSTLDKILLFTLKGFSKKKKCAEFEITKFSSHCNMDNLYFEGKENVMKHVHFFTNNKQWYIEKGRPYTLGICSWGPPGCGKTSFEKALANHLQRHLIVVDFDKINNEDELFSIFFHEKLGPYHIPNSKRLYVFPDIDRTSDILYKTEFQQQKSNTNEEISKFMEKINKKSSILDELEEEDVSNKNVLNLSQILNVIDGIQERDGQIFIMSANHPEKLDPAIVRPGRIDYKIHFKEFSTELIFEFIKNFYKSSHQLDFSKTRDFLNTHKEEIDFRLTPSKIFDICVESEKNITFLHENILKECQKHNEF